jgi:hypothetical protein
VSSDIHHVQGEAFEVDSVWVSDDRRHVNYIHTGDSRVRGGPSIAQARAFAELILRIVKSHGE